MSQLSPSLRRSDRRSPARQRLNSRRPLRAAAATALLAAACAATAAPAGAEVLSSKAASGFRDSIGVQTHTSFNNYASDRSPIEALQRMLKTTGIWHVRDHACLAKEDECVRPRQRLSQLRDSLGAGQPKVDLLLQITNEIQTHPDRATRDAAIERALTAVSSAPLAGMLAGLESANEPDLQKTPTWPQITLDDDATIRRLLAEPRFASLAKLPLLGPPIGHVDNTPQLLDAGWNQGSATVPNFHPYPPVWGPPEIGLDNACTPTLTALDCAKMLGKGGAPWATETGYSTAQNPTAATWISRQAQAVYLPRLLLDNYDRGVARTYLYELIDLSPDPSSSTNGYGLWTSTYNTKLEIVASGAKPAAEALRRLNARIGEAGGRPATGALNVDLLDASGKPYAAADLKRVLLRRADGSFVLAIWQPKKVWDNTPFKQRTVAVDDVPVSVRVNHNPWGGWNLTAFRPSLDDLAQRTSGGRVINLKAGADVTLIDIRKTWGARGIPGGGVQLRK